jgi:hypothetical protein
LLALSPIEGAGAVRSKGLVQRAANLFGPLAKDILNRF